MSKMLSKLWLNLNGTCINCGFKCSYCNLNNDQNPICTQCEPEFNLNNGSCFNCPENCKYCRKENNSIQCIECNINYKLNNISQCTLCPTYCFDCHQNSYGALYCSNCSIGYALSPTKQCLKCSIIQEIGGSGCDKCRYNYNVDRYESISCFN